MVKDKLSGKTCYVYTAPVNGASDWSGKISANDTIYKYIGSDFGTANYVSNLVANGSNFLTHILWALQFIQLQTMLCRPPHF